MLGRQAQAAPLVNFYPNGEKNVSHTIRDRNVGTVLYIQVHWEVPNCTKRGKRELKLVGELGQFGLTQCYKHTDIQYTAQSGEMGQLETHYFMFLEKRKREKKER